jgi:hypothetical protein
MDEDFAFPPWAVAPLPLTIVADLDNVPAGAERRQWPRSACALVAVVGGAADQEALVMDVSESGLGLLAGEHLPPGAELRIEVRDWDGFVYGRLTARVVHVTGWSEDRWLLGCVVEDIAEI